MGREEKSSRASDKTAGSEREDVYEAGGRNGNEIGKRRTGSLRERYQRAVEEQQKEQTGSLWDIVWRWAGYIGIDPRPFTLAQICLMKDEKEKNEWLHTSNLCCVIAKCMSMGGSKLTAEDFNLYELAKKALSSKPKSKEDNEKAMNRLASLFGQKDSN